MKALLVAACAMSVLLTLIFGLSVLIIRADSRRGFEHFRVCELLHEWCQISAAISAVTYLAL